MSGWQLSVAVISSVPMRSGSSLPILVFFWRITRTVPYVGSTNELGVLLPQYGKLSRCRAALSVADSTAFYHSLIYRCGTPFYEPFGSHPRKCDPWSSHAG